MHYFNNVTIEETANCCRASLQFLFAGVTSKMTYPGTIKESMIPYQHRVAIDFKGMPSPGALTELMLLLQGLEQTSNLLQAFCHSINYSDILPFKGGKSSTSSGFDFRVLICPFSLSLQEANADLYQKHRLKWFSWFQPLDFCVIFLPLCFIKMEAKCFSLT